MRFSTSTKVALIVLAIVAVSSASVIIYIPARYHPTYRIQAERLSQQPNTYFYLENPDAYVSQAILNPEAFITVNSLEDTQIDELIDEHNTSNVLVNDNYYWIGIVMGDNFPSLFESYLYLISLVTLPLSVVAIIIIILVKVKRQTSIRDFKKVQKKGKKSREISPLQSRNKPFP